MSWYIRVTDPPQVEPIDLVDVKAHLRVDFNDEDTLISAYITAARELVETECSRALITQTLELGLDDFPILDDRIRIPRGNLQQILNITYTDSGQVDHEMIVGTDFLVNQYAEPAEVVLPWNQIWPAVVLSTSAPVRIQFVCGYGDQPSAVPVQAKQAMLMLIGDWYSNREDVVIGRTSTVAAKLPNGVDRLLTNLRLRHYTPYGC